MLISGWSRFFWFFSLAPFPLLWVTLITMGIPVTFVLYSCVCLFFQLSSKFQVFVCLLVFFGFSLCFNDSRPCLLFRNRWLISISKSQKIKFATFSRVDSRPCICNLVTWGNFRLLRNSQWITFPTHSCLVLFSFSARLLYFLIMWWSVSSHSPHNPHFLFSCLSSTFPLI